MIEMRKKTKEELEELSGTIIKQFEESQSAYEEQVEKLSETYEKITEDFKEQIQSIRTETNFKWMEQVLTEKGGKLGGDDDEMKEEL